jgi:N-acetylmuramoyl-L-alanine amidase
MYLHIVQDILQKERSTRMIKGKLIVIDPGHSGTPDPGAIGEKYKESTLAWKISCKVEEILMVRWGVKVIKTKQSENDPSSDSLSSRYNKANNVEADLFVSIHLNSADNHSATGTETFFHRSTIKGTKLAECIQKQLVECLGLPDRGCKSANFAVLKYTKMTAALVEVGFISNREEEEYIAVNLDTAAEAIAQGIVDYFYIWEV